MVKDQGLLGAEAMKFICGMWREMSREEKKSYSNVADKRNGSLEKATPEGEFSCPWCEKTFGSKASYKNHLESHMTRDNGS